MRWQRIVVASLLIVSVAGAVGVAWLLKEFQASALYVVGGGCLALGLLGLSLHFGTSAAFKERHLSGPGWEQLRALMPRAWVGVLIGAGVIGFEYWSARERARITREADEKIRTINEQVEKQRGRAP